MCCSADIPDAPTLASPPPAADYSEAYNLQAKSMEYGTGIMEQQTELAQRQGKLAEQTFGYWKSKVAPLQTKLMDSAKRGVPTEPAEGRARNAVIQQASPVMRAQDRSLALRGVDPSSAMAVSAKQDLANRSGSQAGMAQYGARRRIEETNRGRQMQAYNLGANIPAQTVNNLGTSAGIIGRAAQPVMNSYSNLANAHMNQAQQESQLANQVWSLQNQSIMQEWNRDVQQAQAEANQWNSLFQTGATLGAVALLA